MARRERLFGRLNCRQDSVKISQIPPGQEAGPWRLFHTQRPWYLLLRSHLDNPAALACGSDHGPAFLDGCRQGFFDIDIFSGLAGQNRGQGMPVTWSPHDHGMDILPVEDFAEISVVLGPFAAVSLTSLSPSKRCSSATSTTERQSTSGIRGNAERSFFPIPPLPMSAT